MKKLLTGNEAIAEGIIESGAEVVCGYPGTPSTEVIQIFFITNFLLLVFSVVQINSILFIITYFNI
ncbi:unnamed protein product, partial [marine sediment metagenome]